MTDVRKDKISQGEIAREFTTHFMYLEMIAYLEKKILDEKKRVYNMLVIPQDGLSEKEMIEIHDESLKGRYYQECLQDIKLFFNRKVQHV